MWFKLKYLGLGLNSVFWTNHFTQLFQSCWMCVRHCSPAAPAALRALYFRENKTLHVKKNNKNPQNKQKKSNKNQNPQLTSKKPTPTQQKSTPQKTMTKPKTSFHKKQLTKQKTPKAFSTCCIKIGYGSWFTNFQSIAVFCWHLYLGSDPCQYLLGGALKFLIHIQCHF